MTHEEAMSKAPKGWYGAGYREGLEGIEERPPESYSARVSYRYGWAHGDEDRRCAKAGYAIVGPRLD